MISTTPDANFYVGRNTKIASGGISTFSVVVIFTSCGTFLHRVALFYIGWHFFTSGGTFLHRVCFFTSGCSSAQGRKILVAVPVQRNENISDRSMMNIFHSSSGGNATLSLGFIGRQSSVQ